MNTRIVLARRPVGWVDEGCFALEQVPEPDIGDAPLYIDTRDRRVHVLQAMAHPRVVVFGNLLSDEECEALIALAEPRMARSLTVATQTGGEEVNDDRTSDGMFFQRFTNA